MTNTKSLNELDKAPTKREATPELLRELIQQSQERQKIVQPYWDKVLDDHPDAEEQLEKWRNKRGCL